MRMQSVLQVTQASVAITDSVVVSSSRAVNNVLRDLTSGTAN